MTPPRVPQAWRLLSLLAGALVGLLLVAQVPVADASHFAYGTISWVDESTTARPNYYSVLFEVAYRRSYATWVPANPSAGQYFTGSDIGGIAIQQTVNAGPCCLPGGVAPPSTDSCYKTAAYASLPNKGCGKWSFSFAKLTVLVKVTYPDDWLSGQTDGLVFQMPTGVYNTSPMKMVYSLCCRINGLKYSAGGVTVISSMLIPGHKYPPRSTSFPRQYVVINTPVVWNVPSIHPNEWDMSYRLATTAESGLSPTSPTGTTWGIFTLDGASGQVTWTPKVLGLYAVQFVISAADPANVAAGESVTTLDTIFQVIASCTLAQANCFHSPVFDPPLPPTVTFYQGSAGTFPVVARSDDNNVVTIQTSPLPDGASINYVSATSGTYSGRPAKWTTYQVLWTPSLTSVPATVCFTARDPITSMSSAGSNCVNFIFGKGGVLYLSGLMRDFHKASSYGTYFTDFKRAEAQVDLGVNYVQPILGANGLPTFKAPATSVANLGKWFVTDEAGLYNKPQVYDIVLNNATTGRANLFRWDSGISWWPLDNQLFGNEDDSHNRYFTLELHSAITYTGGEQLLFESSDDLFVYVNNRLPDSWSLGGVINNQLRSFTINLDTHLNPATDKQKTFDVDIFYAHRSATGPAQLKLSMLSATLCNSLDSGLTVIQTTDYAKVTTIGVASVSTNPQGINLMTTDASRTGAVWYQVDSPLTPPVAQAYKVSHGFEATFSFKWGGLTEGFAFVLQFDNNEAQGGSSGQLGYGGLAGIANSIAIEFDGVQGTAQSDPSWQHISIHSRFAQPNDAAESARISGSVYSPSSVPFTFHNGTVHNVKIQYIPAADNGQGGPLYGWIRVFIGIAGKDLLVVPVTSAQVDGVVLEQMWHGAAYAGFTAASSDTYHNTIQITDFQLKVVPPSASKSYGKVLPLPLSAGQVGSMTIQLKDVCGNVILTGNDCGQITAKVSHVDKPALTQTLTCCPQGAICGAGTIADNGDGSYTLRYNPTFANPADKPWKIAVTYANPGQAAQPIAGSPFNLVVQPGATSAEKSTFALTNTTTLPSGLPRAGALGGGGDTVTVTITARDVYGNLQTALTDPFIMSLDPDIKLGGGMQDDLTKTGESTYTAQFATPQADTFQLYVRLNGVNIQGSPYLGGVTFAAGRASALTSSATGNGLASAKAGEETSFQLALRDSAGNAIKINNGDIIAASLTPASTPPTGYTTGVQTGLPTPVTVPITCTWVGSNTFMTCKYSTNVAYTYGITVRVNGDIMPSLTTTSIVVAAADVSAAKCVANFPTAAQAGVVQTMLLQARDQFSNNKNQPITFTVTITSTDGKPAPIPSAIQYSNYGLHTLTFKPTSAGAPAYRLAVTVTSTPIDDSPLPLTVSPGVAGPPSVTAGIVSPIIASVTQGNTFTISSRDENGNVRTTGGPGSDYIVTLVSGGQVYDTISTIPATTSQTYTVSFGTKIAGSYRLITQVRATSDVLTGGQSGNVTMVVKPAPTSTPDCVVSDTGITGGVIGDSVKVKILAQDQFGNAQDSGVPDTFRVQVMSGATGGTVITPAITRDTTSAPYLYTATYAVPTTPYSNGNGRSYQVIVQRQESGGSFVHLPGSPFTATLSSTATEFSVTGQPTSSTPLYIGRSNTFTLTERDPVTGAVKTGGVYLVVDIASVEESAPGVPALRVPAITVSPENAGQYTVSFTPQFTFPKGNSAFLMSVSRGSVTAKAATGSNGQVMLASPYTINLLAGPVYGPTSTLTDFTTLITAGTTASFNAVLRDIYGNANNTAPTAANPITAVFTLANSNPVVKVTASVNRAAPAGNTPQTFTFSAILERSGVYTAEVRYLGLIIGSTSGTVTVKPSAPSSSKTTIQPLAGVLDPVTRMLDPKMVAGVNNGFSVLLRDAFGNAVVPEDLPVGQSIDYILEFALSPSATIGSYSSSFGTPFHTGSGSYAVNFVIYRANNPATEDYTIVLKVSGTEILPAARPLVHVTSAGIDVSKCTVTPVEDGVAAGRPLGLTLVAEDSYGNGWIGQISVVATGPNGQSPVQDEQFIAVLPTATASTTALGTYAIALARTAVAGPYKFAISANNVALNIPSNPTPTITVVAGEVDSLRTMVPAILAPVQAGTTAAFNMTLRDAFNNIVSDLTDAELAGLVEINYPIYNNEYKCGSFVDDEPEYLPEGFDNFEAHMKGGMAQLSFTPSIIGEYLVNVTINGVPLPCGTWDRLKLTVKPGPAVAENSRVEVAASDVTAGDYTTLRILIRDEFDNIVDHATSNVLVGSNYTGTAWSSDITNDSSDKWVHNVTALGIPDSKQGVYIAQLQPTVARALQVVVTLDGELIQTYRDANSSTTVRPLINVKPNQPYSGTVLSTTPATIFAAEPFAVNLAVTDKYDNPIASSGSSTGYTFSFLISGQSAVQTSYAFDGTLDLPNMQWKGMSAFAGDVTLSIQLVQGKDDACVAADPTKPIRCASLNGCVATWAACPDSKASKRNRVITVQEVTCAKQMANTATPTWIYRCPDRSCKPSYDQCADLSAPGLICPAATPVRCAKDFTCKAEAWQCGCEKDSQVRCPINGQDAGVCVDNLDQCFPVPQCPLNAPYLCATGECRTNSTQCPSRRVCTPGYAMCPDGLSCVPEVFGNSEATISQCSPLQVPATCPAGQQRCASGRCASALADCPSLSTCNRPGDVVCLSDGSCAASASQCPDQYKCYAPTPFRCSDGSCRSDASGCPVDTTCPVGWVMCTNGQCAKSVAQCLPPTACNATEVRCPAGNCVSNLLLCPSESTCGFAAPVKCPDGSCAVGIDFCVNPRVCPAGSRVCADGSCVAGTATCPSTTACSASQPILCADGVTCTSDLSKCVSPAACPVANPMRCPDGSCRGSLLDCPTRSSCPVGQPVRCANGVCVFSTQQCTDVPACPLSEVRCPGGECVTSTELCPTHVTCPLGSSRCSDGSCRTDCTVCTEPCPTCTRQCAPIAPVVCTEGYACPMASTGSLCVKTPDLCPLSYICPASAPVRCLDSSCASSVAACPPLPATPPVDGTVPCADGSWVTEPALCNTPVSCPKLTPYKCADETCRASPADCAVPSSCTNPATPYRCPSGTCAVSPYIEACQLDNNARSACDDPKLPVKCPVDGLCVANVENCAAANGTTTTPGGATSGGVAASSCAKGWAQCRDGTCRSDVSRCDSPACPLNLPFLCASGVCASKASMCPDPLTGCYPPLIGCPSTGKCVVNPDDESQCPLAESNCYLQCSDGLCIAEVDIPNYNAICSSHQCVLRCADRTCGIVSSREGANITASTTGNMCTLKGTSDPTGAPLQNACPSSLPYRCNNGLCVKSSLECIELPKANTCPAERPVECANALCVQESSQCPPLYPCAEGEMRCGDGSCRTAIAGDVTECRAWGIINTCPAVSALDSTPRYRCPNGLCASGPSASDCIDLTTGCPGGYKVRCPNGACLKADSRYTTSSGAVVDLCLDQQFGAVSPVQANGCPVKGQHKCVGTGECVDVTDATDPEAMCLNGALCPKTAPFRCLTPPHNSGECVLQLSNCTAPEPGCFLCADGTCAPNKDPTQCKAINGCPVSKPYRCANGECRKYAASALLNGALLSEVCPPTVMCPTEGQVMCYDGSCVAAYSLCPPEKACFKFFGQDPTERTVLCADRSCVYSADQCGALGVLGAATNTSTASGTKVVAACPASAAVLCDNGACVKSISSCPKFCSPGSSTGSGLLGTIWRQNGQLAASASSTSSSGVTLPSTSCRCTDPLKPIECFDGFCAESNAVCTSRTYSLRGMDPEMVQAGDSCGEGSVACPGGVCVPDPLGDQSGVSACDTIPSCGVGMLRCKDGSCATSCAGVVVTPKDCPMITFPFRKPVPQQRCQDGVCRYRCPSYNGCPHQTPYQCSNRECAVNAGSCPGASIGAAYNFDAVYDLLLRPLQNNVTNEVVSVGRRLLSSLGVQGNKVFLAAMAGAGLTASSSQLGANPTPAPPSSAGTNGWSPCFDNCASMVKPSPAGATVPLSQPSQLVVAVDGQGQQIMKIDIPAGALVLANATQAASTTRVAFTWGPVSDGAVQGAENRIPSSRADKVAPSSFLTLVQSVLSPMVSIGVDSAVALPFSQNLTLTALIDQQAFTDLQNAQLNFSDICLAKLKTIDSINYAAWRCVYCAKTTTDDSGRETTLAVRCPVANVTNAGAAWSVSGSLGEPGVYAFILAPTANPVEPDGLSWVEENLLWLFLGLTGAVVFIFFVLYFSQRLYRYRAKYKAEAAAVLEQAEEVATMEEYGGQAGLKDEEVVMKSNPLVMQMKDMQARLDQTQLAIREQENRQKAEATAVRQEHIQDLQADRDALADELNRLRAQIEDAQAPQSSSRPQAVQMAPMSSMAMGGGHSHGLMGTSAVASDAEYPGAVSTDDVSFEQPGGGQQRAAFQAQRPKKNRKEDL